MKSSDYKITLDSATKRHRDENGFLIVEDNPIAKSGVFEYKGGEIKAPDIDRIYKVYRPFDELLKAKDLFKGKPLLLNHEWVEPADNPKIRGAIGGDIKMDEPYLYADLVVYDSRLIDEIEGGGAVELSPGYLARYDLESGEYEGVAYDYVQRDLKFNHLAVVDKGRSGEDLRVMDGKYFGGKNMLVKTQDEDKRALMSEIEGIIKGKVDEEVWRTIAGKLEKIAYAPSEESMADDESPIDEGGETPPSGSGNTAEELKAAFEQLSRKVEAFLNQEAKEPAHQSVDKTCDEAEEKQDDDKDGVKSMDGKAIARAIKADIEGNYAKVMDAYQAVKPYTGDFNLYAKGRLASESEVYSYGLECLSDGRRIKVTDSKSAFIAFLEGKGSGGIKTEDASPENTDIQKMTAKIL